MEESQPRVRNKSIYRKSKLIANMQATNFYPCAFYLPVHSQFLDFHHWILEYLYLNTTFHPDKTFSSLLHHLIWAEEIKQTRLFSLF